MSAAIARGTLAVLFACALTACASFGPLSPPEPPDQPISHAVPALDVALALATLNALRQSAGAGPVVDSPELGNQARRLATTYALTGQPPVRPADGILHMRYVAGKRTFDEALASWREAPNGTVSLVNPAATAVGIGAAVLDESGAFWVLLLD